MKRGEDRDIGIEPTEHSCGTITSNNYVFSFDGYGTSHKTTAGVYIKYHIIQLSGVWLYGIIANGGTALISYNIITDCTYSYTFTTWGKS